MEKQNLVKHHREKLGLSKEKLVILVNLESLVTRDPIDFDLTLLNKLEANEIKVTYDVALALSRIFSIDLKTIFDAESTFSHYKKVIETTLEDFYREKNLINLKALYDFLMLDYLIEF